ncbi:50S ribosomal protein L15 [Patescibacteria group bacterium]|nr:MAG: 50S ribosomal protein L15 [Patescibacteria group bacterium]
MQFNELKVTGKTSRKRIGRGGKRGTFCGKGCKGQKARSGGNVDPLFEGGRSSLVERLKKLRGFKSPHPKKSVVSLEALESHFKAGETVSMQLLVDRKLIAARVSNAGAKILGTGKLSKALTLDKDILVSKSAKEAIEKAGGSVASK